MKISHIALWVRDLEKIKEFYIKYFNCKCSDKYVNEKKCFESYFLTFEDNCRLEIMTGKDIKEGNINKEIYGFAHISLSTGSKEKVDSLTKELEKDGFKIASYPRTTGDGYYESVILDLENNKIEITI